MRGLSRIQLRGFSLIEILVVVGMLALVGALGLFMSMESYRGTYARSERDMVVSLLERARSRSMNNIRQTSWGVCYSAPNYIIFRGSGCVPGISTNETYAANPTATISGLYAPGVVFSALGGTTTATTTTIVEQGRTETISINNEGRIDW